VVFVDEDEDERNLMVLISRPMDIDVRRWISVKTTHCGSRREEGAVVNLMTKDEIFISV